MSRATCCNGNCGQGRNCPARAAATPAMTNAAGRALIGLVAVLALLALCAGCEPHRDPKSPNASIAILSSYTDEFTGCQYIGQRNSSAGITPRIAADGHSHMGCKGGAQ
jgi:hypothetical protein